MYAHTIRNTYTHMFMQCDAEPSATHPTMQCCVHYICERMHTHLWHRRVVTQSVCAGREANASVVVPHMCTVACI